MFGRAIGGEDALHLLEERHAEELFALVDRNRARLRAWMPWVDRTRTVGDIEAFIKGGLERFSENNGFEAGIWHMESLVGVVGVHSIDWDNKKTSLGYWIGEDHQGRGLVTRSCEAILDHLFLTLGLNRVSIWCAPDNARSSAIPRRLGFQYEGLQRQNEWLYDHFVDHEYFGMLRHEWEARATTSGPG